MGATAAIIAGTGLTVAGGAVQASAQFAAADVVEIQSEMAADAFEFNAQQADLQGQRAIAISQRAAAEQRRQADLVASRALAVAAASGAGAADPTVMNIIADTEAEGVYRAQVALYAGEAEARRMRIEAALGRSRAEQTLLAGQAEATGLRAAGVGTILETGASLFGKYAGKGPTTTTTTPVGGSALIAPTPWHQSPWDVGYT